jgi:hypothetical protein
MTTKSRIFAGALTALIVLALAPVGRTDISRPMIVVAHPSSDAEAAFLMSHFDETHNHAPGEIELLIWPGDLAELDAAGIDYDIEIADLLAHDGESTAAATRQVLPGPDRTDYRVLADYEAELKELEKKNPGLVKVFEMKRPSLEGRTVFGAEIGANVKDVATDGRPIFYVDGVHHAREWPAAEYPMVWVHHLVEKFGKDPKVTSLLKKARVIYVPIVNVDGFNYSRQALAQNENLSAGNGFEGYWRKNRRSLTGVTVPAPDPINPDAYGVDPNRNYSYLWGDSNGGSSGSQIDQTYRGAAPFSEPETQNVRDIVLGRPVTMVLTNHTYQASVLRTGGGDAPEDAILERMGGVLAGILGYTNSPTVGYPTTGTTDDWAYAAMGALGFTIEHGEIGFHPPYDQEVGTYWKQHVDAFTKLLEYSADPKYHSILKGKVVNGPATLTLKKTVMTALSPGNPTGEEAVEEKIEMKLETAKNGSFEWHLSPSDRPYEKKHESYELTISAGGKKKVVQVHFERGEILNLGTIKL